MNFERWDKMTAAARLFPRVRDGQLRPADSCRKSHAISAMSRQYVGEPTRSLVQPYHFGHPETEANLFLDRLDCHPLEPTALHVSEREAKLTTAWVGPGNQSPNRKEQRTRNPKLRAKFWPGMAAAMAGQWGNYH